VSVVKGGQRWLGEGEGVDSVGSSATAKPNYENDPSKHILTLALEPYPPAPYSHRSHHNQQLSA
jgi:hypothetical protein